MLKINLILISLLALVISSCSSNNKTYISDNEDILTADQEKSLESVISAFESKTGKRILIVTSKDIGDYEEPIHYALDFGNLNGVIKKGTKDGMVIFFSKDMGQVALATGYGDDKVIKDDICKSIVDSSMSPLFRQGKYFEGIKSGLEQSISKWE